jgi:hypothetical protein
MRRWRVPGRGSVPAGRRYTIGFDDETGDQVRKLASAERVSFAEKIRQLVEWGLEAERSESAAARSEKR